jgi:hypothetical protein
MTQFSSQKHFVCQFQAYDNTPFLQSPPTMLDIKRNFRGYAELRSQDCNNPCDGSNNDVCDYCYTRLTILVVIVVVVIVIVVIIVVLVVVLVMIAVKNVAIYIVLIDALPAETAK